MQHRELLRRDFFQKLPVLRLPPGDFFFGKRSADAAAGPHPAVPGFPGKGDVQQIFFVVNQGKLLVINGRDPDRMNRLSGSAPLGAVF